MRRGSRRPCCNFPFRQGGGGGSEGWVTQRDATAHSWELPVSTVFVAFRAELAEGLFLCCGFLHGDQPLAGVTGLGGGVLKPVPRASHGTTGGVTPPLSRHRRGPRGHTGHCPWERHRRHPRGHNGHCPVGTPQAPKAAAAHGVATAATRGRRQKSTEKNACRWCRAGGSA